LFFSNRAQRFFEEAFIHCIAFKGRDKRYITDNKIINGALSQQYVNSMTWLKSKLNVRFEIEDADGGAHKELWEIPETVFREAIINSLAHRDYYNKGARITIEVFDDRVEIANPGGLVSTIPLNEFGKRSAARNPLIFKLFEKIRMVEHVGSGITRMRDLMAQEGLTPPEFVMDGMFTVTLRRSFDFEDWVSSWTYKLTANRIAIIKAIHNNNRVSKRELEKIIGITGSAIDNNLSVLKELGFLERGGGAKGGQWIIHYIFPSY